MWEKKRDLMGRYDSTPTSMILDIGRFRRVRFGLFRSIGRTLDVY